MFKTSSAPCKPAPGWALGKTSLEQQTTPSLCEMWAQDPPRGPEGGLRVSCWKLHFQYLALPSFPPSFLQALLKALSCLFCSSAETQKGGLIITTGELLLTLSPHQPIPAALARLEPSHGDRSKGSKLYVFLRDCLFQNSLWIKNN